MTSPSPLTITEVVEALEVADGRVLWQLLLNDLLSESEESKRSPAPNTLHTYRMSLYHFLRYITATQSDTGVFDLPHFVAWLKAEGASQSTVNLRVRIAMRLHRVLKGLGVMISVKPLPQSTNHQKTSKSILRRPYKDWEITILKSKADTEENLILLLGLELGLRVSEMTTLTLSDVVYDVSDFSLIGKPQSLKIRNYRNREEQGILLTDELSNAMTEWIGIRQKARLNGNQLMVGRKPDYIKKRFRDLCTRAGVPYEGLGLEALRLTSGARVYRATHRIEEVMIRMRVNDERNTRRFVLAAAVLGSETSDGANH